MNKTEIKSLLVEECRRRLLATISELEATMADFQQQANDYGAPKDRYDSFRAQMMRRKDMMGQQLSKEMNELKLLDRLDLKKESSTVSFGAMVITKDQNYFISIGLGKMEVNNESYFIISPVVPISLAMNGKKKGDIFDFRGNRIEIEDVF